MNRRMLRALAPYAVLAALVACAYGASIGNGFVEWDDRLLIIDNPISHGLTAPNVAAAFTSYDPELYIPLTLLSYQATYSLAGLSPWAYHLGNIVLHLVSACLVLGIARRLTGSQSAAIIAAALFAVHPLHTETVAWAAARKDVLSGAFALGSFFLWLRWREREDGTTLGLSIACFALGLLAKVSIIGLPVALALIDWARGRRLSRADARWAAPMVGLSIVFGIIAIIGKGESNSGLFLEKALIGAKASVFYMTKLAMPSGLSALYPYTLPITLTNPDLAVPLVLLVIATAAVIALRKRAPWLLAGWIIAFVFLIPSFSNFAKGKDLFHDVYFASDRYAYLASIPALIGVGALVARFTGHRPRLAAALMGTCVAMLATLAALQASTWRDSMALFRNVLRHYPRSHVALNNVATLSFQSGEREKALQYYQASLAVRPNSMAYFNLGVIAEEAGLLDRAEEFYRKALEQNPDMPDALRRLRRFAE